LTLDEMLALALYGLLVPAWLSTAILVWAARKPPRIGALTERAVIAVIIALFLTAIAVIVWNTDSESALFAADVARVVFRVCVLLLGLVPVSWCVLWVSGRLGESGHG
jgi:hypothetical protein